MSYAGSAKTSRWIPYAFLAPSLLLFAVFFVWPAVNAVTISLFKDNVVDPKIFVGLDNFRELFVDGQFHLALRNSAFYLIGMIPFSTILPLWVAVLVNRKLRGINVFRAIYYLPAITSLVAIGVAWRVIFDREGILNWILTAGGLTHQPIDFLLSQFWALPALALVEGWANLGFFMIIYLAGLQAIPSEIYEAARVDGANAWQRMWHFTVPLSMPYTAVTLTLGMLASMRVFELIYIMTQGGPQNTTASLGYMAWSTAFQKFQFGYASAIGIILMVLMIFLAIVNQYVTRERP